MHAPLTKLIRIPVGYRVDSGLVTAPVRVPYDAEICPICDGHGEVVCWDGNPSHRDTSVRCSDCGGNGIVGLEDE